MNKPAAKLKFGANLIFYAKFMHFIGGSEYCANILREWFGCSSYVAANRVFYPVSITTKHALYFRYVDCDIV